MSREYGWDIVSNDGFRPGMVSDVAGRVDFMLPPMATEKIHAELSLGPDEAPAAVKASLIYVWFVPPPPDAQDRMQKQIIRRIEASSQEGRDRILNHDIPAMMAGKNTLESAWPPVTMATAEAGVQ